MNTQPTLKDVAEAAGVGLSTASIVVNGKAARYRIGPSTQERVRAAVRQLGYKPNTVAQKMALGMDVLQPPMKVAAPAVATTLQPQVSQIGLVLSAATQPDALALIPGLEPILTDAGYLLVVVTLPADSTAARERVDRLLTGGVAGFLACPTMYMAVMELAAGKCPVIVLYPNAAKALLQAVARPEVGLLSSQVAELLKGAPPSAAPSPAAPVHTPIIATTSPERPIPTPIPTFVPTANVARPPVQTPATHSSQTADTKVGPPDEEAATRPGNGGTTSVSAVPLPAPAQPEIVPTPIPEPVTPTQPVPAEVATVSGELVEPIPSGIVIEPPPAPEPVPTLEGETRTTEEVGPVTENPPQSSMAAVVPEAAPEGGDETPVVVEQPTTTPEPEPEPQPEPTADESPAPQPEPPPIVEEPSAPAPEPVPQPEPIPIAAEPEVPPPAPAPTPPEPLPAPEPAVEVVAPPEPVAPEVAEQGEAAVPVETGTSGQAEDEQPQAVPQA